jgi:hypothetical protein
VSNFVYAFECVGGCGFFGENTLTKGGRLYCPSCLCRQWIGSSYVERIRVLFVPEAFVRVEKGVL